MSENAFYETNETFCVRCGNWSILRTFSSIFPIYENQSHVLSFRIADRTGCAIVTVGRSGALCATSHYAIIAHGHLILLFLLLVLGIEFSP